MSTTLSLIIIAEIAATLFVAWGFMHEEIFVAFEDKIIFAVLSAVRKRRHAKELQRRQRINAKAVYTPIKPVSGRSVSEDTAA